MESHLGTPKRLEPDSDLGTISLDPDGLEPTTPFVFRDGAVRDRLRELYDELDGEVLSLDDID